MTALLAARQVSKRFTSGLVKRTQTVALKDFTLTIDTEQPSIIGVVGESGSGKSTMARLLLGLETPTQGQVLYQGNDVGRLDQFERRAFRRDVQVVFQDPFGTYNSFYKVDHVLEVPIRKFHLAESRQETRALMEQTLQTVGLRPAETLGRFPHQLSGGQRQRLMVARALLLRPKLIIADEPVSMIDASLRATVLDTLRQLNEEFGISLIYITHDLTTAYQISHYLIVLYSGTVAEAGDVNLVVKQPQHPYTQLLVSSIPLPDPTASGATSRSLPRLASGRNQVLGANLPRVARMPSPLVWRPNRHSFVWMRGAAACYLYQEHETLPAAEMDQLFEQQPAESLVDT